MRKLVCLVFALSVLFVPSLVGGGECNLSCMGPDDRPCQPETFTTGAGLCTTMSMTRYDPVNGTTRTIECETDAGPCGGSDFPRPIG